MSTRPSSSSTAVREPSDSAQAAAEAFEEAGYDVTTLAEPGEPPHMLLVRGKGDRIDVLFPRVEYQAATWDVSDRWRQALARG